MSNSFGDQLLHFAYSVDNLDEGNMEEIRLLLIGFLSEKLGIVNFELCLEERINEGLGLSYFWFSGREKPPARSIWKDGNKEYYGQTSYAYHQDKKLWILAVDADVLLNNEFIDHWSKAEDIPSFIAYAGNDNIRTSIIIPVRRNHRVIGLLNLESEDHIQPTKPLKKELEKIVEGIEIVLDLERSTDKRRKNTRKAIASLKKNAKVLPSLRTPKLFVAFSKNADNEVIEKIEKVVQQLDHLNDNQVVFWDQMHDAGNANEQIIEAIRSASYGLCYFSEKTENGYQDNPNVLFEAGMLHAITNDPFGQPRNWIPIREDTGPIPFDFSTERMIIVPRSTEGKILREFETRLKEMLNTFIF